MYNYIQQEKNFFNICVKHNKKDLFYKIYNLKQFKSSIYFWGEALKKRSYKDYIKEYIKLFNRTIY